MLLDGYQSYLAFVGVSIFVLCGRDSRNGDPGPPNSNPPDPGQGDCDNERDDIEIGTPKIPKKEKSFVVSCICFLDHQLMYLLLVGSMSCTSLLLRSARRALGNIMGKRGRGRGSSQDNASSFVWLSGSGISAVVHIPGRGGKGD